MFVKTIKIIHNFIGNVRKTNNISDTGKNCSAAFYFNGHTQKLIIIIIIIIIIITVFIHAFRRASMRLQDKNIKT